MDKPLVSVIITTKNEECNIENCLQSIKKQSYPQGEIEIIVVDNNSSDKTKEIAKKYSDKVFDRGPERSAQRNYGVAKSNGKYFLYLDADMILSEKVVEECVTKIEADEGLVGLYIPEIIMGDSFWCKVRRFERSFYDGTVIDAVRYIRKNDFIQSGGFDESMIAAEDWDLTKRLHKRGNFTLIKSSLYHNEGNFNLFKYIKKKGFYSADLNKYIWKWGKKDLDLKKQFGLHYRFCGVFLEFGKWKKLVTHPILSLGMYWLRILVGIRFLIKR